MGKEGVRKFLQFAMTPGGFYYPSPTEAELTYTDDEARTNAAGDPDIKDFPQEMIDQLKTQADALLGFIFPNLKLATSALDAHDSTGQPICLSST